ncbi:TetR family transcriptional regulator [Nocardia callitridis]|uniref:TetR family transcriptional regulator n=1 Tax=Nocardia callitridis TaxID=648753 RepID=A0ABP9JR22_9NOCA
MSTRGDIAEVRLRPTICEAVEKAAASLDDSGVRALRVLLHSGVSVYWPMIKAAPTKQIRAYERTVRKLCERWEASADAVAEPVNDDPYRHADDVVVYFLELCAERSGTKWLEPVDAIGAYVVSVLQGVVLRWLADDDDEAMLVVLDDLVTSVSARAVAA